MTENYRYTCNDYRLEMILLSLRQRLTRPDIPESEKKELQQEIRRLESQMGMV